MIFGLVGMTDSERGSCPVYAIDDWELMSRPESDARTNADRVEKEMSD